MKYLVLAFAASTIVTSAIGQTPPAAKTDGTPPRHNCPRPEIIDTTKKFTKEQMAAFVASVNKFKECAEGYAQVQQKEAERVQKAAQVTAQELVASGNLAIKDYNDFVEQASKAMAATPPPPKETAETTREGNVDTIPSRIPRKN